MNVRVPPELRDAVDARRGPLGLSRDVWIERALTWALAQPVGKKRPAGRQLKGSTVANTVAGRTIDGRQTR